MKTRILHSFILFFITGFISGQIIHVPGDYPSIQDGINASSNGDTVLVAEGTWYENIRFMGKAITLGSEFIMDGDTNHINNTIINGSQSIDPDTAACVLFINGEDTTSILNGFTITGGTGVMNWTWVVRGGGGIYASNAGAKIINNKIMNNQIESTGVENAGGGGIYLIFGEDEHWAVIENNTISHNTSTCHNYSAFAAGISISINGYIKNNIIEYNACINDSQIADGGGIEVECLPGVTHIDVTIDNNIIRHNSVTGVTDAVGAGLMGWSSGCVVTNNVFMYNTATSVDHSSGGGLYINVADSGTLLMNNEFKYNTCEANNAWGAGARIRLADYPVVKNNEFCYNTINSFEYGYGSGLVINRPGYGAVVTGNTISNNEINKNGGYSYGGGCSLYKADTIPLEFGNNIIENNNAVFGGAIYIRNSYNLNMYNNIFRLNHASYDGGALHFWHYVDDKELEGKNDAIRGDASLFPPVEYKGIYHNFLANNDFVGNVADWYGGAIYSNHEERTHIFLNNIFWQNMAYENANEIYNENINTLFYLTTNDIDTAEIRGNWEGHGNISADPLFIDDQCHINCADNPCIDAGDEYVKIDGIDYYAPLFDIDGTTRPLDNDFDIGADEETICTLIEETTREDQGILVSPNPCSGAMHLRYSILDTRYLILEMYSVNGVKVKTLLHGFQQPGDHEQTFDISGLPNGLYFIRMQAGKEVETAKLLLIK